MLAIRSAQMEEFGRLARAGFEREMVSHLAAFSPALYRTLGAERMLAAVQVGVTRAGKHGFTFRGPVRLYLETMLLLGSHFDSDPQYPWAKAILAMTDGAGQLQRAERLYEGLMDYRRRVTGSNDEYAIAALKRIALIAGQSLDTLQPDFMGNIVRLIGHVYPQKLAYLGREPLEALAREGLQLAQHQGFRSTRGAALIVLLMLAFGHGCAVDPLYPWIGRTLKEDAADDAEARAKRLEARALTWLEHALVSLQKSPE